MAILGNDGVKIAYDDIGAPGGACIVLLHGFASNRGENWRRLGWYGAFERRRIRVIAGDMRGHGESAKPHDAGSYTCATLVKDVIAMMDAANVQRAHVMGYSMGARIALATALGHPDRIDHLILGGVGGTLFEPRRSGHLLREAMMAQDPHGIAEPLLRSFRHFADEQGEDREALAACGEGFVFDAPRDALSSINAPTLVIAGQRDALAGNPEELARLIPGARAVTLPGCDHFSAIPHALFKAAVFDFLDGTLDL